MQNMIHYIGTQLMQNRLSKSGQCAALRRGKPGANEHYQKIGNSQSRYGVNAILRQAFGQKIIDDNFDKIWLDQHAQIGN